MTVVGGGGCRESDVDSTMVLVGTLGTPIILFRPLNSNFGIEWHFALFTRVGSWTGVQLEPKREVSVYLFYEVGSLSAQRR